jgi:site-specific recombinase XerD
MDSATLRSPYGNVKPYTRHLSGCSHRKDNTHNGCKCPKWIYEKRTGEKDLRRSLTTPSWPEAQRIASDVLRGYDPEIAEARKSKKTVEQARMTITDASKLFEDRTEREFGAGGTHAQHCSTMKKFRTWADRHGIQWVQDVTALHLEAWYSSSDWSRYARATQHQRWAVMRTAFSFWVARKVLTENPILDIKPIKTDAEHVQGPYTDEQVEALLLKARTIQVPGTIQLKEKPIYNARLTAFIQLLLHTGCDLGDGVMFNPADIEDVPINGRMIPVYRYHRIKTGLLAVIPLSREIAKLLGNVPTIPGNSSNMPFGGNTKLWSKRIRKCLSEAGVHYVTLPATRTKKARKKKANSKMLRHTFAVQQLVQGQRPEEVAKMLGHANTDMVLKHYAPWVKELDSAHVRMVEERRTASLPNRGLSIISALPVADEPAVPHSRVSAS